MENKDLMIDENLIKKVKEDIREVYLMNELPWVIGYSGGKDSTMLVMLVFEMLAKLRPEQINKKIYITSSDTMVENPIVKNYMYKMSEMIGDAGKKLGIISNIIKNAELIIWTKLLL